MSYQKVKTKDGSFTLHSLKFNECYHSVNDGALSEALQKHVMPAFRFLQKHELKILDICFGLGFNTFATIYYALKTKLNKKITIYSPEFDQKLLQTLSNFEYPKEFSKIQNIIQLVLKNHHYKDKNFEITLLVGDARQKIKDLKEIDIIYQDPFSPKKNPLLWTQEYFQQLFKISSDEAVMTTYSIATPVRLAMDEAGFFVYEYKGKSTRKQTIASKKRLQLLQVDLEKKLQNNPNAKSLRDSDFL